MSNKLEPIVDFSVDDEIVNLWVEDYYRIGINRGSKMVLVDSDDTYESIYFSDPDDLRMVATVMLEMADELEKLNEL